MEQYEEMARQAHGMLREAQELEAKQNFLGSLEVAKQCVSSSRHIKACLRGIDADSGPLNDGITKILSQPIVSWVKLTDIWARSQRVLRALALLRN